MARWNRLMVVVAAVAIATSVVWALTIANITLGISVSNPALGGRLAEVVALTPSTFTVARGQADVIQGLNLYDIENIDSNYLNRLSVRFFLRNPHELGGIFYNPRAYLEITVTPKNDPNTVYASGMISKEAGYVTLRPVIPTGDIASLTDPSTGITLRVRASVVVPGGRPPGQQDRYEDSLVTYVQVSTR